MTDSSAGIRLDQFLKLVGAVGTGGQAKMVIQAGEVSVNGQVEKRRSHHVRRGDKVSFAGADYLVDLD